MSLTGMSQLNIELTSFCSKKTKCFMCGHQSPNLRVGSMRFELLQSIALQIEPGIITSFHRDGDSVDYERLGDALRLFSKHPTSIVTHGERLNEKSDEIINNCTSVTVSVIPNDPDREIQLESIAGFLAKKGARRPMVQLKCVGRVENLEPYEKLGVPITNRALHSKKGNWNYHKIEPIVPEIRVCLDFLGRPTVDWRGRLFICNRLDTLDDGLLGDLNESTLDALWNSPRRAEMLAAHLAGRRDQANALCASCDFWGVSTPSGA